MAQEAAFAASCALFLIGGTKFVVIRPQHRPQHRLQDRRLRLDGPEVGVCEEEVRGGYGFMQNLWINAVSPYPGITHRAGYVPA